MGDGERRVYCWRAGVAVALPDGERCPECGGVEHSEVTPGECGAFVPVTPYHGVMCTLPVGHGGEHAAEVRGD